jgi:hypothetical protein
MKVNFCLIFCILVCLNFQTNGSDSYSQEVEYPQTPHTSFIVDTLLSFKDCRKLKRLREPLHREDSDSNDETVYQLPRKRHKTMVTSDQKKITQEKIILDIKNALIDKGLVLLGKDGKYHIAQDYWGTEYGIGSLFEGVQVTATMRKKALVMTLQEFESRKTEKEKQKQKEKEKYIKKLVKIHIEDKERKEKNKCLWYLMLDYSHEISLFEGLGYNKKVKNGWIDILKKTQEWKEKKLDFCDWTATDRLKILKGMILNVQKDIEKMESGLNNKRISLRRRPLLRPHRPLLRRPLPLRRRPLRHRLYDFYKYS